METRGATLHMLLFTTDPLLVASFKNASRELGIEAEFSQDCQQVSDHLNHAKYEGVVVDFDTVSNARPVLASVRKSPSNQNAVLFAVATNFTDAQQALEDHAHFLLQRPIEASAIRQTLDVAYDLMLGERRRNFRNAVEIPVLLTIITSGTSIECSTINISSNGMAITTPVPFNLAEPLDVAVFLSKGVTIRATGLVIWNDTHGKCGLQFQCKTPEMRHQLDSWLDSQFATPPSEE